MNKLILTTVLSAATLLTANAVDFETAADAVKHMGPGINLANSLECHSRFRDLMYIEASAKSKGTIPTIEEYETAWEQPQTTRALIKLWKDAGFNAVRVPVTWFPHMDITQYMNTITLNTALKKEGYGDFLSYYEDYLSSIGIETEFGATWSRDDTWMEYVTENKIDKDWMDRVQEVVDMIIEEGMYCIINVHHDTGALEHSAPQGTKADENLRWLNASKNWWPIGASSQSAPFRDMSDGSSSHDQVLKVVNEGGDDENDPQFVMTFDYPGSWSWYVWSFEIYALENSTLSVDLVDENGNSFASNATPESVVAEKGKWKKYTYGDCWGPDGGTYKLRVYMNTKQDGVSVANTYYIDNVSMTKENNPQTAPTTSLVGNGGTMTTVTFADEELPTDPGTGGGDPNTPSTSTGNPKVKAKFIAIWNQICERFGDYGDHLLFEGYNEVLRDNAWDADAEGEDVVADMAKTFIETVRATGGNNANRNLIVNTYAAKWRPVAGIAAMNDQHIIIEAHNYPTVGANDYPWPENRDASEQTADGASNWLFGKMAKLKTDMGGNLPIILGEWGTTDIFESDVFRPSNVPTISDFSEKLLKKTKDAGMATFIWRSLCDETYRSTANNGKPGWNPNYIDIKNGIMKGWYGENGYGGVDYGVYPNLYTVHNGTQLDKDNGYLATNRAVLVSGTTAMTKNLTITDGEIYRFGDNNVTAIFADKLTFTRVFRHDKWMPLYVPFAINVENFSEVAEFAVFNGISQTVTQNNGTDEITVTLNAEKVNSGTIAANTPCLIKLKAQGSVNPSTFRDTPYTFEMTMGWSSMYSSENGNVLTSNTQNGVTWTLGGTYEPLTGNQLSGMFAMTEGRFRACLTDDEDEVLRPNRIYLKVTSQTGAPMRLNVVVSSDDEELSSIADIFATPHDDVYYDLMGRPVAHPTHGFYIRNGQKVFIK